MRRDQTLNLIARLCDELDAREIAYCHWKSNNVLERSETGENDLDLLVERSHAPQFAEVAGALGFKHAEPPAGKRIPGIQDFYGYDAVADRLVHLHVHYQLVVGDDLTKNYRLRIERPYIASSSRAGLLPVPVAEFEYVVFVLRMAMKHCPWETLLLGSSRLTRAECQEYEDLRRGVDQQHVMNIVHRHFPSVGADLFGKLEHAIEPESGVVERVRAGVAVGAAMEASSRRGRTEDVATKASRKIGLVWSRRIRRVKRVRRLASGGSLIAIVGGDGAGKTTIVDELHSWLSRDIEVTTLHLGKPRWSRTTTSVRALLAIGRFLRLYPHVSSSILYSHDRSSEGFRGMYPWMFREVCRARDRYHTYVKAARIATAGGVVVCDRYPLAQVEVMDSPHIGQVVDVSRAGALARLMMRLEERYYARIGDPDTLVVLRVDPNVAVQRKTDEDPTEVRLRSTAIWEADWRSTPARVIDAQRPPAEVLSEVKSIVWSEL